MHTQGKCRVEVFDFSYVLAPLFFLPMPFTLCLLIIYSSPFSSSQVCRIGEDLTLQNKILHPPEDLIYFANHLEDPLINQFAGLGEN